MRKDRSVSLTLEQFEAIPEAVRRHGDWLHYLLCLDQGTSPTLAEMFALQQPPMSNTDREFLQGHVNGNQFSGQELMGDHYKAQALAAGVDPKGKVYLSGLAAFPGDPEAWVSGRGDVQKVCEQRGWDCEGSVTVKAYRGQKQPAVGLDPALVEAEVDSILEKMSEPQAVDRQDLTEQVRAQRKPHWSK